MKKSLKIHSKTPVRVSSRKFMEHAFSCKLYEVFTDAFSAEHLRVTVSDQNKCETVNNYIIFGPWDLISCKGSDLITKSPSVIQRKILSKTEMMLSRVINNKSYDRNDLMFFTKNYGSFISKNIL